jgi:hypothetical protein
MSGILTLLPCPFCGADAEFVEGKDKSGRFIAVGCPRCGAGSSQHYPLMDDARPNAANAWNTRTDAPWRPTHEYAGGSLLRVLKRNDQWVVVEFQGQFCPDWYSVDYFDGDLRGSSIPRFRELDPGEIPTLLNVETKEPEL